MSGDVMGADRGMRTRTRRVAGRAGLGLAAAFSAAAALSGAPALAQSTPVYPQLPPGSFADLAARLSPSVVNISTAQTVNRPNRPMPNLPDGSPFGEFFKDFFDNEGPSGPRRVQSLGSGFVVGAEGYVVTNNHVIEGADEIEVNFSDGRSMPAELRGRDTKTDLALLKVVTDETLPFVEFGDSDDARVGDWVLAIGNPFGLGGSVSAGIISARDRDINSGPYDEFIQTDAAINRGNSGGPLFNMAGQVIGVNTAIISPSGGSIGIGFSVPSSLARRVIEQLREHGETRRGWLGVSIQDVDDAIAESMGLDRAGGAMVTGVVDGGPADSAGVRIGDVILRFDGRDVDKMRDLPRIVADTPVDSHVQVELFRDGAVETIDVLIALLDESDSDSAAAAEEGDPGAVLGGGMTTLGMTLELLDQTGRERYGVADDVDGVLVSAVDQASAAAERGVRAGDVLVEVAHEAVSTPEEARDAIERARAGGRRTVLLMLHREGGMQFLAVEFDR